MTPLPAFSQPHSPRKSPPPAHAQQPGPSYPPLASAPTAWDPTSAKVTLNARLDARIVPSASCPDGMRVDFSHIVVLDGFFEEAQRAELLAQLTHPAWDHFQGPPPDKWEASTADTHTAARTWGLAGPQLAAMLADPSPAMLEIHARLQALYPECTIAHMPADSMQAAASGSPYMAPADLGDAGAHASPEEAAPAAADAAAPPRPAAQIGGGADADACTDGAAEPEAGMGSAPARCMHALAQPLQEHSSNGGGQEPGLAKRSRAIQASEAERGPAGHAKRRRAAPPQQLHQAAACQAWACDAEEQSGQSCDWRDAEQPEQAQHGDCCPLLANAAVAGDVYSWHVDADPSSFPDSLWRQEHGDYCNREPSRPLFVSLLLYLNDSWPRDWDAETLFLDGQTDIGLVVRPRRYRAVLMDQDVLHRLSPPAPAAGGHPRYSLVWKLLFLPRTPGQQCCIARPEWGPATHIGSAAHLLRVKRALRTSAA